MIRRAAAAGHSFGLQLLLCRYGRTESILKGGDYQTGFLLTDTIEGCCRQQVALYGYPAGGGLGYGLSMYP